MTFSTHGLTGYEVEYWDGSTWTDVTGGNLSGNNKVWRKFTFSAITTSKIRVLANAYGELMTLDPAPGYISIRDREGRRFILSGA